MAKLHTSEITLKVGLDENRVPEELTWSAQDGGIDNEKAKLELAKVEQTEYFKTFKKGQVFGFILCLFILSIATISIFKGYPVPGVITIATIVAGVVGSLIYGKSKKATS